MLSGNPQLFLTLYEASKRYDKESIDTIIKSLTPEKIRGVAEDQLIEAIKYLVTNENDSSFLMSEDIRTTLKNLSIAFGENCHCQIVDIFTFILKKYQSEIQE